MPAALLLAGLGLLVGACQPLDDPLAQDSEEEEPAQGEGSGEPALAGSLEEVLEHGDAEARTWSGDAVLIDLEVALDAEGTWEDVTATYVAGGADEVLEVTLAPDPDAADGRSVTSQTVRLATLGVDPLPSEAAAELPDADDLADPDVVVEEAVAPLEGCEGSPPVREIRYTTGALAAWDADGWTLEPRWRLTARDVDGAGVSLDATTAEPVDGAQDACVPPPPEPDDDAPAEVDEDPGTGPLVEPPDEGEPDAGDAEPDEPGSPGQAGEELDADP